MGDIRCYECPLCDIVIEDFDEEFCICDEELPPTSRPKRVTGRAYRRVMEKQKTARLRKMVTSSYIPHAWYIDWGYVDGKYIPIGKHIKYPRSSEAQRYLKKHSNKIVRRSHVVLKGSGYRKAFDYQLNLY